ncbi:MAG TPA: precorrin-6y C5,15-methyltransferase (decarboxylating) subunit CbiE [Actinomycetes bacterium]|nr:precorrin-6y C5,15-methyltransferase (decarboxylating) subunit CbiE [Actinomycetes bacterium]
MSERAAVTIVGIGDDGWDGLTEMARAALRQAPVIVGSTRQLALLPDLGVRQLPLPSPLLAQLDDLVATNPGLCLLASGDPMLHGLGATLARRLGTGRLRVLPAVSSVALACARLGWAEHEVDVVSLVSRPVEVVLPAVQPGARVLVLGRDGGTPNMLARLLADRGWGGSELMVLEHLGGEAEQVSGPVAAGALVGDRFADLTVLALVCKPGPGATVQPRVPGLPDDAYESDGQLTRREARALALAALAPGPGQLLWDVGAGSGSIGIEWMRVDARCRAVAVERRGDRAERVRRNALALGVPDLEVVCGEAPAALTSLPRPDAVFVGGGLTTDGLLDTCWERLRPGGRLVAHAVTIESEAVLHRWQQAVGGQLVRLAASHAGPLGGFTTWRPALPITQWQVTRP